MARPLAMVLLVLAISACRNGAYNAAAKADTPEAWRQFLAANPKDDNVEAARARLAALEFEQAKAVHSLVAYKRFVEEFPQADDAPKALALLEALRFNAVSEAAGPQAKGSASDRASAWRNFLRDHPAGAHHEEAEKQLALLELVDLANLNDAATLARVAAEHPDDPRSLDAASKLDGLDWANAVTAAKLYAYLRQHPDGAHRDEAKVKLLSLQVDGLLVSGLLDQAQAEVKKNPLSPKLPDFGARLAKARVQQQLEVAKDERIRRALPAYHVRAFDDVVRSLHSPDPMDRWEAAEELGFHVSVKAIDPLLDMVRGARSVLVRQRAFESLGSVLRSLPHDVAEYEVATRLETLRAQAADTQLYLSMAALLDLSGQLELASFEYQRAYEPNAPEPVILRRWAQLRRERRQFFSAAVAARQLSVWAAAQVQNIGPVDGPNALTAARHLCAVRDAAQFAEAVIAEARANKTEFADEVEVFWLRAQEANRLAAAKLRDAELALLTDQPNAAKCADHPVRDRLDASTQARLELVADLKKRPTKETALLFEVLKERDPSAAVRAAVQ